MIAMPNCANEATGMARIRKANNSNRILRILNHLAGSSLRLPGPTLLLRAAWIERRNASRQGFHGGTAESVHYSSLFVNVPIRSAERSFPRRPC